MWHLISIIGFASKSPLTEVESQVSIPAVVRGRLPGSVEPFLLFGGKVRRNLQDLAGAPHCINEGEGAGGAGRAGPSKFHRCAEEIRPEREGRKAK